MKARDGLRTDLRTRLAILGLLPRFLRLVWETRPSFAVGVVVLRISQAFGPVVLLWVSKLIFDQIQLVLGGEKALATTWPLLVQLVLLELTVALVTDLLVRGSLFLEGLLGELFGIRLSAMVMAHAASLDLSYFEDPEFYDQLDRARRQTAGRLTLLTLLLRSAQNLLTVVTLLGALVVFSPWLLLLLAVAVLPAFAAETHFAQLSYALRHSWTPERRQMNYLVWVASSSQTAKEVKLFGLSDHLIDRYTRVAQRLYEANQDLEKGRAMVGGGLSAISTVTYYGTFLFLIGRTLSGALSLGDLTFATGSFQRSRDLTASIFTSLAQIYEQSLFLNDLFSFIDSRPTVVNRPNSRAFPGEITRGFRFENVSFRYPGSDKWALRDVSFELRPSERVALVGENGAGKTTVVKLLTRLYEPTEGRILLDGIDLRDYDLRSLQNAVGVIFQDFVRYDMRVRDNIAVGDIKQLSNQLALKRAARKSMADRLIESLNHGYDQMLGKRFESGTELSLGEWQKIALARAYLRDSQVLILDEPTASLDARAEYDVFLRFSELIKGRIALLISHRFSTVRMADRILVLDQGQVTESGSHSQLLGVGGTYAELFAMQASGYR